MDKKQSQKIHATKRFKERYGLNLTQRLEDYLRCAVHSGGAFLVKYDSKRTQIYDVLFRPQKKETNDIEKIGKLMIIRFSFDKKRNQVVTALPR
jgi:Cu/Ag efflux pump CusA